MSYREAYDVSRFELPDSKLVRLDYIRYLTALLPVMRTGSSVHYEKLPDV